MAKYLILIYGNEPRWDAATDEEMTAIGEGHRAFRDKAGDAAILSSGQLESSTTATTLRSDRDGKLAITDGPFLETKEVIGGYYVLDVADLDAAISLSGLLAETKQDHSWVEVHPLVDHG
jgi:hypothetical protein